VFECSGLRDFGLRKRLVRRAPFVLNVKLKCGELSMLKRVGMSGLGWEVVLVALLF
jgi:hypothetical protein